MPSYLTLEPHLSRDDLEQGYRRSHDPVERSHWHIVWLIACGHHVPTVAPMTGYTENGVRTIMHRYNAGGANGVGDRRHANPGQPPWLDAALREALRQALGRTGPRRWALAEPQGGRLDGGATAPAGW